MEIGTDKSYLKEYRKQVKKLYERLDTVNLLIEFSTEVTYPTLIIRKRNIIDEINMYEMAIRYILRKLETLSRV